MGPDERLDRLLSWREVQQVTGLGRTTAWRLRNAGDFPQPVALSPGRVAWRERDIAAWSESRSLPLAPLPHPQPRQRPLPASQKPVPPPGPPVLTRRPPASRSPTPPTEAPPPLIAPPAPTPTARPKRRRTSAVSEDQLGFDF
jgi:predicted DNA-binding transcriptional regulator AlpA